MQTLSAIEKFMRVHFKSNFKEMPVALAKLELKSGKRAAGPPAPPGLDGGEAAPEKSKRVRVDLTSLGRVFIDTFLGRYIELSGKPDTRAALFKEILQAATVMQESIGSHAWTTKVVSDRLHNALKAHNKAARAAAEAETPEPAD